MYVLIGRNRSNKQSPQLKRKFAAALLVLLLPFSQLLFSIPRIQAANSPWTQTDWSGGSGQTSWSDVTKYSISTGLNSSTANQLSLASSSTWCNNSYCNSSWSYQKKITFNNTTTNLGVTSENLINFPVLIKLTSANIDYSQTQNNGQDIRFTDSDGSDLAYEIEKWDETGTSIVWVKIPQIDGNSNTDYIYLYHGNAAATDHQQATSVWNSSYVGVWHLKESGNGTAGEYTDSTSGAANGRGGDGTALAVPSPTSGQIGNAQTLDGSNDFIRFSSFNQTFTNVTISAWINASSYIGCKSLIFSRGTSVTGLNAGACSASTKLGYHWNDGSSTWGWTGGPVLPTAQWIYITLAVNSSSATAYVGNSTTLTSTINNTGHSSTIIDDLRFGQDDANASRYFGGAIDEVRISNTNRSAAWIAASYKSESNSFITMSTEAVTTGTLTSSIFDTGFAYGANFGILAYSATIPANTAATIKARSSDSSTMSGASDFSLCNSISNGDNISSNNCISNGHRYIQYQLTLSRTPPSTDTPTITSVSIEFTESSASPWTQTTWNGGSGQASWIEDTKFSSSSNVFAYENGQVSLKIDVGNGADGAVTISSNKTIDTDTIATGRTSPDAVNFNINSNIAQGSTTINLGVTPTGLAVSDDILIINLLGTSGDYSTVGQYEIKKIASISSTTLTLDSALSNSYNGTTQKIMIQRVPNYTNVTIQNGGTLTVSSYNNTTGKGGILFFKANGTVTVNSGGSISVSGKGYPGGVTPRQGGLTYNGMGGAGGVVNTNGQTGQGGGGGAGGSGCTTQIGGTGTIGGAGGAGGQGGSSAGASGGGGGYSTVGSYGTGREDEGAGQNGTGNTGGNGSNCGAQYPNAGGGGGGGTYGTTDLTTLYFGSGGGSGGESNSNSGGAGGGIIVIYSNTLSAAGSIISNGSTGGYGAQKGQGGGGAGGSILLKSRTLDLGSSIVTATGGGSIGPSGTQGGTSGSGGLGRIAVYSPNSINGATSPTYETASADDFSAGAPFGTLTSSIFDTGMATGAEWGTLTYNATTPSNTLVTVKARSSDSSSMTGAASFLTCNAITSGTNISANSCIIDGQRYIQYQIMLSNTDSTSIPTFQDISITFSEYDRTPPTGGSISYNNGNYSTAAVPLTVNDGTDIDSGIDTSSRIIQRRSAVLTNGVCDSYGSFTAISPTGTYPNFVDTSVTSGNCYQYQYLISDMNGNQSIYTNSNTAKIDPPLPTNPIPPQTTEVTIQTGYTLKIKVVDSNGNPVAGAKVEVYSVYHEAITNQDGIAEFYNIEEGEHEVIITYDGFQTSQTITVTGNSEDSSESNQTSQVKALSLTISTPTPTSTPPASYSKEEVVAPDSTPNTGLVVVCCVSPLVIFLILFILSRRSKQDEERR